MKPPDLPPLRVRSYQPGDLAAVMALFHATVRSINRRDYSQAQVEAWAPDSPDEAAWAARLAANDTRVAQLAGTVAGFVELEAGGHLHALFVHQDHQRKGIARRLLATAEQGARDRGLSVITTEASITARPCFEAAGFAVTAPQTVTLRGQSFVNYRMQKTLD